MSRSVRLGSPCAPLYTDPSGDRIYGEADTSGETPALLLADGSGGWLVVHEWWIEAVACQSWPGAVSVLRAAAELSDIRAVGLLWSSAARRSWAELWRLASALAVVVLVASACGSPTAPAERPAPRPVSCYPNPATGALVCLAVPADSIGS